MKILSRLTAVLAFALVFAFGGAFVATNTLHAQDDQPATEQENHEENQDTGVTYEYVAQVGDSYSLIARKAVQTYGLKEEVNLSQAQILYAETNLTQAADSPELTVGQEVSVSEATVAEWVNRASELSDEDEAAWQAYVPFADFNTDHVGEARDE